LPNQFEKFIDPVSNQPLYLADYALSGEHVKTGRLRDRSGRTTCQVSDFIPRFTDSNNYTSNFGLQWIKHTKTQLDSYNKATYSFDRLFQSTRWSGNLQG